MHFQKLGRQTDGPLGVMSGGAVFDAHDIHLESLSGEEYTASHSVKRRVRHGLSAEAAK
jgi:hypothetical protein